LPLNIFESELRYRKPFSNAALLSECIYPDIAIKLVAMATSLEKRGPNRSYSNKYLSFGAKVVKISPVDPVIICLHLKKKETTEGKIYSPVGRFAERAK